MLGAMEKTTLRPLGRFVIALDTSALLALLNRRDPDHLRVRDALLADSGPYLVLAGILAETASGAIAREGTIRVLP